MKSKMLFVVTIFSACIIITLTSCKKETVLPDAVDNVAKDSTQQQNVWDGTGPFHEIKK